MSGLNMALGRGAPGLRPCGKAVPMPLPAARRPCRAATFKTCAVMQAELAPAATARVVLGGGVADPATVSVPSYVVRPFWPLWECRPILYISAQACLL